MKGTLLAGVVALVLIASSLVAPVLHAAETGIVHGVLLYGNIMSACVDSRRFPRDCDGARVDSANANFRILGVPEADIVVRTDRGVVIAEGSTDAEGRYALWWYSEQDNPRVRIQLLTRHSGGRFRVTKGNGEVPAYDGDFFLLNGVDPNDWVGFVLRGGATSPTFRTRHDDVWGELDSNTHEARLNLFAGAWYAWDAVSVSPHAASRLAGIEIHAYDRKQCPTACFRPRGALSERIIISRASDAYDPINRVGHEYGHYVSHVSNRGGARNACGNWRYGFGDDDGWDNREPEWAVAGFEEALATYTGFLSMFEPTADDPRAHAFANDLTFDLAPTVGLDAENVLTDCDAANAARRPLNALGFLWDLTDSRGAFDEPFAFPVDTVFSTIGAFPSHESNGGKNESCNLIGNPVGPLSDKDRDGRSALDFATHYYNEVGVWPGELLELNCDLHTVGD